MSLTCAHCTTPLPEQANFCFHCGAPVIRANPNPPTRIFAIANQKGRTGKTTTAINLGAFLANAGRRTLIVDLSPSSEATTGLGVDSHAVGTSIHEMLLTDDIRPSDGIRKEIRPYLALLPAKVDLYGVDMTLCQLKNPEFRLQHILDQVRDDYEFVLIDCPSWLGLLTINALTAADGVILPLRCEYFTLEGMQQLLNTIRLVRDRLNHKVMLFGVILTMYDPHTSLAREMVDEISQHFPREKFDTLIPNQLRLAEAATYGRTILEHDPRSPGALAYKELTEELIVRAATMESHRA